MNEADLEAMERCVYEFARVLGHNTVPLWG